MHTQKKAFTLVELITTLAIVAVISIIWFTYTSNYKLTQYNVRRTADVANLQTSIKSFYEVKKTYPTPAWNKQYYTDKWVYNHSGTWAYWVSW
jgi:prepilin-type N-terminal cleavage/methylation domain-containing protein